MHRTASHCGIGSHFFSSHPLTVFPSLVGRLFPVRTFCSSTFSFSRSLLPVRRSVCHHLSSHQQRTVHAHLHTSTRLGPHTSTHAERERAPRRQSANSHHRLLHTIADAKTDSDSTNIKQNTDNKTQTNEEMLYRSPLHERNEQLNNQGQGTEQRQQQQAAGSETTGGVYVCIVVCVLYCFRSLLFR